MSVDVDGNGWNDVMVITGNDNIVLYSNSGPNGWQMHTIDNLGGTYDINDATSACCRSDAPNASSFSKFETGALEW
jgi:hypothetical protein